jgi:outer membrane lipoprotein-sorting protein
MQTPLAEAHPARSCRRAQRFRCRLGTERRCRRRLSLLLLAAGLLRFSAAPAGAQTQDPRALLGKVMAAYQALNSYEGTASVDTALLYKEKVVQTLSALTVDMKYKRPNLLRLHFSNPAGTETVTSDGKTFTVYSGALNQFAHYPTASNLALMMLPLLRARAGVQAGLDPLYFMGVNQLPPQLTGLKYGGSTTYNGKPVFVVSGMTRGRTFPIRDKQGHQAVLKTSTEYWTWWINRQTFLLEKIESRDPNVKVVVPVRQGKKVTTREYLVTRRQRHIILSATPNPPLANNVFAFTPPAGAVERKSIQDILKDGK